MWSKKFSRAFGAGGPSAVLVLGPGPSLDGPSTMSEKYHETFKFKRMDIIANRLLNLILEQYYLTICVFNILEICLFLYDVLNVKKHICRGVSNETNEETFSTTMDKISFEIKKLLVLWPDPSFL